LVSFCALLVWIWDGDVDGGWVGGNGGEDDNLQWMVSGKSHWKTKWVPEVWHNIAYDIVSIAVPVNHGHSLIHRAHLGFLLWKRVVLALDGLRPAQTDRRPHKDIYIICTCCGLRSLLTCNADEGRRLAQTGI
jgi:hypothetical protein